MITGLKWLVFDFGGCLDADGLHSRAIFFHFFLQQGIINRDEWELFQDAYTHADKKVIADSLVVKANLFTMNFVMSELMAQQLNRLNDKVVLEIANKITSFQAEYLIRNRGILIGMSKKFKLGIISNFSGNLELILQEYGLFDLFDFVLDSYHEGVSKPDVAIFKKAIKLAGVTANEICYMGDNAIRDIIPASKLGMRTIHLFSAQENRIKTQECSPDAIVNSFINITKLVRPA